MPLTPEERKKAARAALKTGDPEYATGTITKPKMTPKQEARYDAAVAGHQSQLAQEEPDYAQHEFDPLPQAAKTTARMAGEAALGMNPATSIPLDSYYMKEAIEEGGFGDVALAGAAFVPLVGEVSKLAKATKAGKAATSSAKATARQAKDAAKAWKELGTDSPYFKKWFGDSKVTGPDGKAVRVYHGTSKDKDFKSFKTGSRGAWFTTDPKGASMYAADNDSRRLVLETDHPGHPWGKYVEKNTKDRVIPAYITIKKPYVLTAAEKEAWKRAPSGASYEKKLVLKAKREGHDGIDFGGGTWVVFEPTQVKSATGNTGMFDPTKKDITASRETAPKTTQKA